MQVLILGVNGFIGHSLVRAILERRDWTVVGLDLVGDRLAPWLDHPRLRFVAGDVTEADAWLDEQVREADVVLPLVAIATPMAYVRDPLRVFEITFEANLEVVRSCARYGTRLVFPSTSEVYGMCPDAAFDEDASPLVLGPIHRQRWIYACCKQLLDRVIWAHGQRGDFPFTLFRPFNWIGPGLDDLEAAREGSSRVVTQFIGNLLDGSPIRLVDGGFQTRSFTYVDDGIDCLLRILEDRGVTDGEVINIGNPHNECSMRELAERLVRLFREHPSQRHRTSFSPIVQVDAHAFYGDGYQDMPARRPSIDKARRLLGWSPRVGLDEALGKTLDAALARATPIDLPLPGSVRPRARTR